MGEIKYNGRTYSGLIQANGCFVDTDNVIASGSYSGSFSYTATEDCFFYGEIANDSNNSASIQIDGKAVFMIYDSSINQSGTAFVLKKGQTISLTSTFSGAAVTYKVFGIQQGSPITFLSEYASACYDTNEREVGCWIDGKPIYQKTFVQHSTDVSGTGVLLDVSTLNIDTCVDLQGICDRNVPNVGTLIYKFNSYEDSGLRTYLAYSNFNDNVQFSIRFFGGESTSVQYITILYTKTTDTVGSGKLTPTGFETHHYSTNEQIVGTWIDGKPIYEITLNPTVAVGSNLIAHGIANLKECISIKGKCKFDNGSDVLPLPYVSTNTYYMIALGNVNATNYLIDVGSYFGSIQDCYVTIQYTKTTD